MLARLHAWQSVEPLRQCSPPPPLGVESEDLSKPGARLLLQRRPTSAWPPCCCRC
jgi:hypothetical protein